MTEPATLSVIVPIKEIDSSALKVIEAQAKQLPKVDFIAVGALSAQESSPALPSNLLVIDAKCGIYAAMNRGAQAARSSHLLFMGLDDEIIGESARGILSNMSRDPKVVMWVVPVQVSGGRIVRPALRHRGVSTYHHQSVLFSREALLAMGSYNEEFRLHSDLDLMLRLQKFGSVREIQSAPLVRFAKGGMSTSGQHSYTSIREFILIFRRNGISLWRRDLAFHTALLLFYRLKYNLARVRALMRNRA